MNRADIRVGQDLAWEMADQHVMAGRVTFIGYSSCLLKRVDGGQVEVSFERLHPATPDEILKACDFFTKIGR